MTVEQDHSLLLALNSATWKPPTSSTLPLAHSPTHPVSQATNHHPSLHRPQHAMMPAAQRSITHYTGLDISIEAAAKNPKIVPSVVSPTGVQLSVVSMVIITITTTSTLVITLCRVTDSRLPPSGLELIDNVGVYKFSLMEISDHADTQGVHLFSDSDHDHFIGWEDDDILGRLLRVPGGYVCGKKLPTLIRSSMVFYTCVAANNECSSYMSSSDGAAKH